MTNTPNAFADVMTKHGWARCDVDEHLGYTPMGGATWRRDHVRIELTSQYLVDRDWVVSYYMNDSKVACGTISAIVVDPACRGKGHGHGALLSILAVLDELEWDQVYLEAIKITRRGTGPSRMGDEALRYWYMRHGFKPQPRYNREGKVEADSQRVLMRERPGLFKR